MKVWKITSWEAINYDQKEMLPMSIEENEWHKKAKEYYIKEKFWYKKQNFQKVRNHCHFERRGAGSRFCNLWQAATREIFVLMHYGSKYDFHLIIKLKNAFKSMTSMWIK